MISTTPEQLERLLNRLEDYNLEFKKASNNFDSRELRDYCAALANEHGGKLLLGVQQKQDKTGEVTGTTAFENTYNTLSHDLLRELNIRVDVEEVYYSGKRVLIFHVPSRPVGSFIRSYYASTGTTGVHTRLKGIPREAQKQLIIEHLARNKTATAKDFGDIFPHLSRHAINGLLKDLKKEGKVRVEGKTRGGVWHLA